LPRRDDRCEVRSSSREKGARHRRRARAASRGSGRDVGGPLRARGFIPSLHDRAVAEDVADRFASIDDEEHRRVGAKTNDVEAEIARMAGPSGLMPFAQFDHGAIASLMGEPIRSRLYIVVNPAIRLAHRERRCARVLPCDVSRCDLRSGWSRDRRHGLSGYARRPSRSSPSAGIILSSHYHGHGKQRKNPRWLS
jgi:hypothetical protein